MQNPLSGYLAMSAEAAALFSADPAVREVLEKMAARIAAALRAGGCVLIAGNGGSAADAQHLATEFVSRVLYNRPPMAALALSESAPILTACGNDYGFDTVFARQVQALGRKGDVLLGLSTSGNSPNVLAALATARSRGMVCLGFSGAAGGAMTEACDLVLRPQAQLGQIVQQLHMMAGHALLFAVENAMFRDDEFST